MNRQLIRIGKKRNGINFKMKLRKNKRKTITYIRHKDYNGVICSRRGSYTSKELKKISIENKLDCSRFEITETIIYDEVRL